VLVGIGLSNGLVSTAAGVLAAQATSPARRGEALGVYYVATSLAVAAAAPGGIALFPWGGVRPPLPVGRDSAPLSRGDGAGHRHRGTPPPHDAARSLGRARGLGALPVLEPARAGTGRGDGAAHPRLELDRRLRAAACRAPRPRWRAALVLRHLL